jgi:NACHT domain
MPLKRGTKALRRGSLMATHSRIGNSQAPSCGLMEIVCSPALGHLLLLIDLHFRSGIWQECYYVCPPNCNCFDYGNLYHRILASAAVIQDIERISNNGTAFMGYFFFDFKDTRKQDIRALLSSLLVQLSDQSDSYTDKLLALYASHRRGSELPNPGNGALTECLEEMLKLPQRIPVYFLIDALDECPDSCGIPSSRGKVLELVKRLVELHLPNLRLFTTSRPESNIRAVLEPLKCPSISLHTQSGQKSDIVDYITHVVRSEVNMKRWREEDKSLVIRTLSERAGGM